MSSTNLDLRESPERIRSLVNIFNDSIRFLKNVSFDYHSNNQEKELFNTKSFSGFFVQLESLFFRIEENIQKLILRQFFPSHHASILNNCVTILKNSIYFFHSMHQCDLKNFHFFKNLLNIFENGILIIDEIVKGYNATQIECTVSDKLLRGNFLSICEELEKNMKLDVKLTEKNGIINKIENSVIISFQSFEGNKNENEQKTDVSCNETNEGTSKILEMNQKPQLSTLSSNLLQNSIDVSFKSLSKNKQAELNALIEVINDQINFFSVCPSNSKGKKLKLRCKVCNISKLTSKLAERHVSSNEHLSKLLISSEKENNKVDEQFNVDSTLIASLSSDDMQYLNYDLDSHECTNSTCTCGLCNVEIEDSPKSWLNHFESEEHKKNLEETKWIQRNHEQSTCEELNNNMKSDVKLTGENENSGILSFRSFAENKAVNQERTIDSYSNTNLINSQFQEIKREPNILNILNNLLQNSTDFNFGLLSRSKQEELKALSKVINYQINYFSLCSFNSEDKKLQLMCKVCNINGLSSKLVQRHVNCHEHLENLLNLYKKEQAGEKCGVDSMVVTNISAKDMNYLDFDTDSQQYMCCLCNMKLPDSQSSWVNHFKTKEHKNFNAASKSSNSDAQKDKIMYENSAPNKLLNGKHDDSFQAEMLSVSSEDSLKSSDGSYETKNQIFEEALAANKIRLPQTENSQVSDHSCDADFLSESDTESNASSESDRKKSNSELHSNGKNLLKKNNGDYFFIAERACWRRFRSWEVGCDTGNFSGQNAMSEYSLKLGLCGLALERHLNYFTLFPDLSGPKVKSRKLKLSCNLCTTKSDYFFLAVRHILSYDHVAAILMGKKKSVDVKFSLDISKTNLKCLEYDTESENYSCFVCVRKIGNSYHSLLAHFNGNMEHKKNVNKFLPQFKHDMNFGCSKSDAKVRAAIRSIKYHLDDFSVIDFDSYKELKFLCKLCDESVGSEKLVEHVVYPNHYQKMLRKFNGDREVTRYSLEGPKLNIKHYESINYLPKFRGYGCNLCQVKLSLYDSWIEHFESSEHKN